MAKREISIILKAKNEMQVGLANAGQALQSFGSSVLNIGKMAATAFLAAGTAIAGFAAKALSAYSVQEQATNAVKGALRAYGDEVDVNTQKLSQLAAAIQDETGASDESTLAGMAKMRMLGVQTEQLGEAARAVIALKSVGLEEAAAQKAVAMAMQGNYEMLNRYVPALRNATTETEKAAIVNDLFSRGYQQQQDQLGTLSGRWAEFKGRLGDAWEAAGEAISQNGALSDSLAKVSEYTKQATADFAEWVASGGVENLIAGVQMFAEEFKYNFMLISNAAHTAWASIGDGIDTVITYTSDLIGTFVGNTISTFKDMGEGIAVVARSIVKPWTFSLDEMSEMTNRHYENIKSRHASMVDALAGKEGVITERTDAALKTREALHSEHYAKMQQLNAAHLAALEANNARQAARDAINAQASAALANKVATVKIEAAKKASDAEISELEKSAAKEINSKPPVIDANRAAAESVLDSWESAYAGLESASLKSADTAIKSAKEIAEATSSAASGIATGGTFESGGDRAQAIANLRARGTIPANGSVLTPLQSEAIQQEIRNELVRIRQQNERLLTLS